MAFGLLIEKDPLIILQLINLFSTRVYFHPNESAEFTKKVIQAESRGKENKQIHAGKSKKKYGGEIEGC